MNKNFVFVCVILTALLFISASTSVSGNANKMQDIKTLDLSVNPRDINSRGTVKPDLNFGKFPLYFIFNKGQVNKNAKFYAKASRYTLWLTKEGLVFDSVKKVKAKAEVEEGKERHTPPFGHPSQEGSETGEYKIRPYKGFPGERRGEPCVHPAFSERLLERDVSRLVFLDANKNPEMIAIEEAKLRVNYFIGNDKSKWHCDVPTSQAVLYKNLYKNIDLKVYGIEKQIEYDWIVKPGGNPKDIRFEYKNVKGTRLDDEGNLLIETDFGELMHKRPISYQKIGMEQGARNRVEVNAKFKNISENIYGFEVGEYDKDCELIIDPVVLAYSTYLGGSGVDYGTGIDVDNSGNVYVTGITSSTDFPVLAQYQTDQGGYDVFLTKLDTTQTGAASLIYSTYLGGGNDDYSYGIAVDNKGFAYVTGYAGSSNFPTRNQYQTHQGRGDVFLTKINTNLSGVSGLIYSTYLGGGDADRGLSIAVDSSECVYLTGDTSSTDFPTLNQYEGTYQGGWVDAFVTKIDTTQSGASSLIYSTYLGGGDNDQGGGIEVDSSGYVYVAGFTVSANFPTLNQFQTDQGGADAFVTKLDTTQSGASSLIYSTYLGGGDGDGCFGIAVDNSGNVYVTGFTWSSNFPIRNQYQTNRGSRDAFVTKIDTTRSGVSGLIYSTYLGGGSPDTGTGIAVDSIGNAYVTGYTESTDFPTLNQFQIDQGGIDGFVTKIDTTRSGVSSLIYSTYLGGSNTEYETHSGYRVLIAVDSSGNAYVTGYTESTDFPIRNQYQTDPGDNSPDAFVTKLSHTIAPPTVTTAAVSSVTATSASSGGNVTSDGDAAVTARGVCWSTSPNPTITSPHTTDGIGTGSFTSSITGLTPGTTYHVRAYATNSVGTSYGSDVSFTTNALVPTITTTAASNITSTTASSGGNVTSDGGSAIASRGVCWSTSANPTTANSHTTDGTGTGAFTSSITGLNPGTIYHVRAYATNSVGTSYGNEVTFTTIAVAPTVTTTAVSNIGSTTASSGGNVISDGGAAVTARGVCWSTSANPTTSDSHTTDGTGTGAFTSSITGLTPGTTYHVRAYATNSVGTSYGNDVTFTTIAVAPTVTTTVVSNITATTATSGGNVTDAGGAAVTARGVCWSTSANPTISDSHTTDGTGTGIFTSSITGLTPGTTYHVRAYATNSVGTSYGSDITFTTNAVAPTVITTVVSNISSKTASSGGNVTDDGGAAVTVKGVCWSTSANPTTSDGHTTDGTGTGTFTSSITGLAPGTTYHVRAYATNSVGTSYGSDITFTTNAVVPTVTTIAVSDITATSASSGGNVSDDGGAPVTARGVCWGTSTNPTISDSHTTDGSGTGTFTSSITGLTPDTTYYLRAYATNTAGTAYGNEATFTTAANPIISGTVTDGIDPIEGVNITFSHDKHTETTNAKGHYSYTVPYGTTTTITPSKTGYGAWTPAKKTFTNITSNKTQNFTANLDTFTISGTITDGTNPIEGVSITFSHDGHIETTDALGNYSYSAVYGTSTTVSPSKPGYSFSPSEYSYTNLTEHKLNQDFTVANSIFVTITNPHHGDTVSGAVLITAEASCTGASAADASTQSIAKIEFYIDGILVKQDTRPPYEHRWDTTLDSNGSHTITAKAFHSSGLTYQHEITVNVNNSTDPPHIELNRTHLNFGAVIGESQTGFQTFLIGNSGGGILDWSASVSDTWIQTSPLSGTANMVVTVSVDVTGLAPGSYIGNIAITDPNADNSPAAVDIYLEVKEKPQELPVFGSFDSPKDGSVVYSSIPVTGWALDDVEVSKVKIFRSPVEGHEIGLVYIGDAVFVEGARPDVEGKYPAHPKNYQAGWGYMMLTNFLPNQGNGTFEITAIATDSSGNEVPLGSKTIICDNANAVKPFGAIDTPFQGGDASGIDYVNWGWVLTPQPNTIPTDGSTINVWVDGVPLPGNPVYNQYREDIASLFPGYNNSNGAVGYYYLDTTLYANGVHTIAWSASDDAGNTDGVGSRYFKIMNVENLSSSSASNIAYGYGYKDKWSIQNLPVSSTPIYLKKGYKTDSEQYILYPDNKGNITIDIKEDERIEIEMGDKNEIAWSTHSWAGFQVIGDIQRPLPIGSTLDVSNGIFYWQPGPGFIGKYKLVFIEKGQDGEFKKRNIKVVIKPEF